MVTSTLRGATSSYISIATLIITLVTKSHDPLSGPYSLNLTPIRDFHQTRGRADRNPPPKKKGTLNIRELSQTLNHIAHNNTPNP